MPTPSLSTPEYRRIFHPIRPLVRLIGDVDSVVPDALPRRKLSSLRVVPVRRVRLVLVMRSAHAAPLIGATGLAVLSIWGTADSAVAMEDDGLATQDRPQCLTRMELDGLGSFIAGRPGADDSSESIWLAHD
jgi:hypothetical protein